MTKPYLALVLSLLLPVAACGNDGTGGGGGGGGGGDPDASVIDPPPPTRGFQVISPDVTIMPGQEITYCYYFHTPNTDAMVIKRWSSTMTAGSHHMIMYTTASDAKPPGTIDTAGCGGFSGTNLPSWTYATQTPTSELVLPTDDGAGMPLGQDVAAGTPAYFQMHYLNSGDMPIQAHVTLNADAYDVGAAYTKTAAYITYNSQISVGPGATGVVASQSCNVPAGSKFWTVSTHAHKQAVKTEIKDGATSVFSSIDWEHPGSKMFATTPFYTFASGKLTYECTYNNTGSNAGTTVVSGPSAQTNEMCMGTGYYFPAQKPLACLNNLGPF